MPLLATPRVWQPLARPWPWLGLAAMLAVLRMPTFQLWGDVRYTLGVERATALTGWSAAATWTHRPLLNRLLMAGLDHLTVGAHREDQLLLLSALLAGLAVWPLATALAPRLGRAEAAAAGSALLAALVWAPPRTMLQPEWYALVLAASAVGVGAHPTTQARRRRAAATASAALMVAAVLMKWTTAGTAATAWLVLVALTWRTERRRLVLLTLMAAVLLPLVLGAEVLAVPHEGRWLTEIPRLNPPADALRWCSPLSVPHDPCHLQSLAFNEALGSPLLLLLPAAVVLLVGTLPGRARWAALVLPVLAVALSVTTTLIQAQYFSYHVAAVPVVAAGWVGWAAASAVRRTGRVPAEIVAPALIAAVVLTGLLARPAAERTSPRAVLLGHSLAAWTYGFSVLVALSATVGAVTAVRRTQRLDRPAGPVARRGPAGAVTALALLAALALPLLPAIGYSFDGANAGRTALGEQRLATRDAAAGAAIRARIGPGTPVVYLGFGDRPYWVREPTSCRYAAATFLQRSAYRDVDGLASLRENLACLADPRARYAVVQNGWIHLDRADPAVRQSLATTFDCDRPVLTAANLTVCPRR
ncbi:hypothetical protein [uncultured Friedmanniella sp.]|uniref:hypothetical protein n=1 Tax=uncultured Friedmanniella sp. TaxID=335381 RepID=UPI0035C9A223